MLTSFTDGQTVVTGISNSSLHAPTVDKKAALVVCAKLKYALIVIVEFDFALTK